jgi:hypothetical protein
VLGLGVVVVVGQDEEGGRPETVGGLALVYLGDVGEDIVERRLDEVVWLNRGSPGAV